MTGRGTGRYTAVLVPATARTRASASMGTPGSGTRLVSGSSSSLAGFSRVSRRSFSPLQASSTPTALSLLAADISVHPAPSLVLTGFTGASISP